MNVEVQFHRQVEADLERWLTGGEDDEDRLKMVRVYLDEMIRTLKDAVGQVPRAIRIGYGPPHRFRW